MKKKWEESEIDSKWETTGYAKKALQRERRKGLNDFERFKVSRLRKQVRITMTELDISSAPTLTLHSGTLRGPQGYRTGKGERIDEEVMRVYCFTPLLGSTFLNEFEHRASAQEVLRLARSVVAGRSRMRVVHKPLLFAGVVRLQIYHIQTPPYGCD